MQALEKTKLVRKLIRENSSRQFTPLYTNKYSNCRTVKTYGGPGLAEKLEGILPEGCTVKYVPPANFGYRGRQGGNSVIVRIPND